MTDKKDLSIFTFDQVKEMAKSAADSNFFPGVKTPQQALVLMALAQAEGIPPIQAMMRYDVIQGRPAKRSQAMLADFLSSGGRVEWLQHSDQCCEAKFSHPQGGEITVRWDLEKAKKADLLGKDNWKKHPESMLHARCVSNGVRFVYPAATGGLYDPAEVQDFEPSKFAGITVETTTTKDVVKVGPVASSLNLPDLPDQVKTIPIELAKGKFGPLGQFDGIPISRLSLSDLELVISLISDNREKVKDEKAKSWLLAIEAESTLVYRDKKMDEGQFEEVNA